MGSPGDHRGSPLRHARVFVLVVLALAAIIVIALLALLYTLPIGPATTG